MPRGATNTLRPFPEGASYSIAGDAPTDLNSAECAAPAQASSRTATEIGRTAFMKFSVQACDIFRACARAEPRPALPSPQCGRSGTVRAINALRECRQASPGRGRPAVAAG